MLASEECPVDAQEEGHFLIAKSLLPNRWPTWEEGVRDWVDEQMELWYATPDHSGAIIPMPVAPSEPCTLELTPGRLEKPKITITAPAPSGTATYPVFTPRIDIDSKAKVHSVRYAIDGKTLAIVDSPPFVQALRVPRSISEEGRHTLSVELTDEYFNKATYRVQFRFEEDKKPPQVSFVLPRGDIRLPRGGTLTMEANAEDLEGELKYVQFFLGDTLLSTKPKAPYRLEYNVRDKPGVYTLLVVARDLAGNISEDRLTLTVD